MASSAREWVIFGSTGLLGSEFRHLLESSGEKVKSVTRNDFSVADQSDRLCQVMPEGSIVLNCIAYTKVDQAEAEPDVAKLVNSDFVGALGNAARDTGSAVIHFSTDYVFSGSVGRPYLPTDLPKPVNTYGRTKLEGEYRLFESGCNSLIVRTSWLYGTHGKCFPLSVASRLLAGQIVRVVDDQVGSPTWTRDLVQWIMSAELGDLNGPRIEHLAASGQTSWFGFANEIAELLSVDGRLLERVSSAEADYAADRPSFSVLQSAESFGPQLREWRQMFSEAWPLLRLVVN